MAEEHKVTNKNKKLFIWAASLTLFFALLEIVYGFISGSLMIIGDGVHMSSDAISLTLALIASIIATKAATSTRTFGFKRFEPVAAFINGVTLILIPLYIIYEAITRIINPIEINHMQMIIVGTIGLVINGVVGFILSKGESNLNMRSAMLHVIADMITSLSAVIVGVAILLWDLTWLDPIGSIVTSIIIIRGGFKITKEALGILMEGVPEGYSVESIHEALRTVTDITAVNDVKLWCINEEEVYIMIRVTASDPLVHKQVKEIIATTTEIPRKHIYVDVE